MNTEDEDLMVKIQVSVDSLVYRMQCVAWVYKFYAVRFVLGIATGLA